ncbi:MAG TPA: 3-dehydroquinate synthase II [Nitrososphaeraceae archaeon]|nr:3-dehydroquinate synthase II [Nitrososphaeraceae archaeon]
MPKSKEIVIKPAISIGNIYDFLTDIKRKNIRLLYLDPQLVRGQDFKTIYPSNQADIVVCETIEELKKLKSLKRTCGFAKKVSSNDDLEGIVAASEVGPDLVIIETTNWKIIPLENIIARLHKSGIKIYTTASSIDEVRTMFAVLELGVDGVIFTTGDEKQISELGSLLENTSLLLKAARIVEIKDVGAGERVCIDTASMLKVGEGLLVGSKANFLFLIHNESIGSSFTSPRPFRVNAGAVHCYTLLPDGKTKYLSEIESGVEILVVSKEGLSRHVVVGRSKIETRPLRLIKAEMNGEQGSIILQNAETIRVVTAEGKLVSVTDLKVGTEILAHVSEYSGRHFGMEVDEYVLER